MHILLIHQYFLEDHAGGGSRWNEMARIWVQEGHSVTVIAGDVHYMQCQRASKEKYFTVAVNKDRVTVLRCKGSSHYHSGFIGRFWGYVSFALSATYAGFRFATDRYDCVLVTSPPLLIGIPGVILSKCKHVPLVLEVRDLWPESAIETGVLTNKWLIRLSYRFEKFLYKQSALINVLTPAFKEKFLADKGVAADKLVMVPNAADFHWSEKALLNAGQNGLRAKLGLTGKFLIVYVGAHGLANGLMQLVEAADLLSSTSAHFLLIGDGMQKAALMKEVAARKLQNVTFLSPVGKEQVFDFIVMADVGIAVLKKTEVFKTIYSNKTFDYLSCQKPVLMAIDGISRKLIEDAAAGLFVEPENPADLAQKVQVYMENPGLLHLHGMNGYDFVGQHFDRKILARRLLESIENQLRMK